MTVSPQSRERFAQRVALFSRSKNISPGGNSLRAVVTSGGSSRPRADRMFGHSKTSRSFAREKRDDRPMFVRIFGKFLQLFFLMLIGAIIVFLAWLFFFPSSWNSTSQRVFLLIGKERSGSPLRSLSLLVLRPQDQSAYVLPLPDTLTIEPLGGYGRYKVSSLVGLQKLDALDESFVSTSLASALGIHIDWILWTNIETNDQLDSKTLVRELFRSLLLQNGSSAGEKERYDAWKYLRSLRQDQLSMIDPISSRLFIPSKMMGNQAAPNETVYEIDMVRYDIFSFDVFSDPDLRKESATIAIVNTTDASGFATRMARTFTSMGMNVIHVSTNTGMQFEESQIIASSNAQRSTKAYAVLSEFLQIEKKQQQVSQEKSKAYRADIVLFLGKDAAVRFTGHGRD